MGADSLCQFLQSAKYTTDGSGSPHIQYNSSSSIRDKQFFETFFPILLRLYLKEVHTTSVRVTATFMTFYI